ncbi:hypothetical protein FOPG_16249 [Fusarium oxysporum f. sp. conglutinans race 2 54008]|uniref:Uncharacterized protein n=2 Tax=Fusarium oxysporum f. sp. conglutinans TaxID=100902 RepID=F9GDB1_FUSOF|nr:hypothetical protein FOXB_16645 [Fusarium oxysporum f. sp. conglutinans Fo5176]EXL67635.1 hypothetical protein FOPG_16249 [Fusarium oxysporum f. sp. conglutinans race 2 54008]KAG6989332.1 hypothetical protein FocnCong_v020871 [Fusarium oxysporum f. sp. conglutinans]
MHKVDWKDSTPERRLAIMNLVEKYPHILHPAGDDTAEPPSSLVPPSQRPDIPGMSSDVFTQPALNASSKTRKAWREGCPPDQFQYQEQGIPSTPRLKRIVARLPTSSPPDVRETQQIPALTSPVPQTVTPTTSSHVYPVLSPPPMSSNRATTELNKLLSELEEARNRFHRLLPQTVDAQAEMERCETKVKQFYMANGPGVVSNQ